MEIWSYWSAPKGKRYLRRLVEGDDIHGTHGVLDAATLAAAEYDFRGAHTPGRAFSGAAPFAL